MKKIAYIEDIQICNCPNQHLLLVGEVCDLCMGIVVNEPALDEFEAPAHGDLFDDRYFEALESFYEDITFAA